ncbi:GntR family transcriptional regulator [Radiobacillus sp. PE A8.2]|uniref:GntR family transcriptional regulator n=1 Tax=Radiobacillus sp. PE A8.2 TaxID=3380349 RepID=UPI00388E0C63
MTIDFLPDRPIYLQLIDRICSEIVRGERQLGEKLDSVRDFAVETGVNANTIQRVYRELEQMQITETKRGQGTFVTTDKKRLQQLREEMKSKYIEAFLNDMNELGFTVNEMIAGIEKLYNREGNERD